jgi:poly(hydroxyalkanoate) depolymerase family esterase
MLHRNIAASMRTAMTPDDIVDSIQQALRAGGLDPQSGPMKEVLATIEQALGHTSPAGQGLAPGSIPPVAPAPSSFAPARIFSASGMENRVIHHGGASRRYALFVPSRQPVAPAPLLVMLHGCKQNPEDFARGTRMNRLAEEHGFLVAYPEQARLDNGGNCWNWFVPRQQERDGSEPTQVAQIVHEVMRLHPVAPGAVYVAGLSAGAAMAVVLGQAYPELFSGVAAHSGLPMGSAHSVSSAFAAMRGKSGSGRSRSAVHPVPTLVIHGDADKTVAPSNGQGIVDQALAAFGESRPALQRISRFERNNPALSQCHQYLDASGRCQIEQWIVPGGAHTWFGGDPSGSYTASHGPDASALIAAFFGLCA